MRSIAGNFYLPCSFRSHSRSDSFRSSQIQPGFEIFIPVNPRHLRFKHLRLVRVQIPFHQHLSPCFTHPDALQHPHQRVIGENSPQRSLNILQQPPDFLQRHPSFLDEVLSKDNFSLIFFNGTIYFMVEVIFFHCERVEFFNIPRKLIVFHLVFYSRALTFANKPDFRSKCALFEVIGDPRGSLFLLAELLPELGAVKSSLQIKAGR